MCVCARDKSHRRIIRCGSQLSIITGLMQSFNNLLKSLFLRSENHTHSLRQMRNEFWWDFSDIRISCPQRLCRVMLSSNEINIIVVGAMTGNNSRIINSWMQQQPRNSVNEHTWVSPCIVCPPAGHPSLSLLKEAFAAVNFVNSHTHTHKRYSLWRVLNYAELDIKVKKEREKTNVIWESPLLTHAHHRLRHVGVHNYIVQRTQTRTYWNMRERCNYI